MQIKHLQDALSGLRQYLATESPTTMMRMLFISPQKLILLYFCLDFLVMYQNDLIQKIILLSNFMPSQPWTQTIAIHILPNISRSKGNQTKKIDQLIEYNMRNILREKIYAKGCWQIFPRPFSKNSNLGISLDQ